jgi:hypothetical protein
MFLNQPTGIGTINITGSVFGGNGTSFFGITSNATNLTLNISGSVYAGPFGNNANGISISSTSAGTTVNIIGNTVGTLNTSYGVYNASTAGVVTVSGSAIAGLNAAGAYNNSTGTIRVISAIASTGSAGLVGVSATGTSSFENMIFASNGQVPILGYCKLKSSNNNYVSCSVDPRGYKILIDSNNILQGLPVTTNVRSGTVYNFGNSTGTMVIPATSNVLLNVPVDNTSGSAVLTTGSISNAVWNTATSTLTTAGSIGDKARNVSTVSSVGDQLVSLL